MLALHDYLALDGRSAAAQWQEILRREVPPLGKRQVDFSPLETLLCFGLGLIANQSPSGAINIPVSSRDAQALAKLFRRTPKSLAAKLANLDGRRANGAKHEQELWIRLTDDMLHFEALYARILDAGRRQGLGSALLPDFLGFGEQHFQIIFEADKVSDDELRAAVELQIKDLGSHSEARATERALLGTARVGQQQFARKVLTNAGFQCVFCGLSAQAAELPVARMLIASHVKPWSKSENYERTDPQNGLAACPTHDSAFEGFLFSVTDDGRIQRSRELDAAIERDARFRHNFGEAGLSNTLLLPPGSRGPGASYLAWHRTQMAAPRVAA